MAEERPPTVAAPTGTSSVLRFSGCAQFRQRLVCSVLSGRPVRIDGIRAHSESPGLLPFEASFLRLLDKLCNGSKVEINETGTLLRFRPGFIVGGKLSHDCGRSRAIGWFLEGILPLLPFAKAPTRLTLDGITNDDVDCCVDTVRNVTLPLLRQFGLGEDLQMHIKRRGAPPAGGGRVVLLCPVVRELRPICLIDVGSIRRMRGVAYSAKVNPRMTTRMLEAARELLNEFEAETYIHTDAVRGKEAGGSAGYGLTLWAETTTGVILGADTAADSGVTAEDVGNRAARLLLQQVLEGGCVDGSQQSLMLLFMLLCPEDVSKLRTGPLTDFTIDYLRTLKRFFGIQFRLKQDVDGSVLVSCLGLGYKNLSRRAS